MIELDKSFYWGSLNFDGLSAVGSGTEIDLESVMVKSTSHNGPS